MNSVTSIFTVSDTNHPIHTKFKPKHFIFRNTGIKKTLPVYDKVYRILNQKLSYFFFLFCSSTEIDSRIEVSAMMFLYFM